MTFEVTNLKTLWEKYLKVCKFTFFMGKQRSYLQIFQSTRKITKFWKELTSDKTCSDVDSEVYFHHVENRFLNVSKCVYIVEILFKTLFFVHKTIFLVILSTVKLSTCVKNKIYLLLQFIEKIVKFQFFFIAEFDISTSTKMLEILISSRKLVFFFTFFQLNYVKHKVLL